MLRRALLLAAGLVALPLVAGDLAPRTVCTITVNSDDEKNTMAARLPPGRYTFVELVEKGRGDWLRSACKRGVQCDVLVVSGHFNAGETFYSDRVEVNEHLEVDELERAACSDSCPGVFAKLKEVYLFGCESLNPDATKYSSSYGESGRERMRRIFAGVPKIYGFSSSAPVGPTAAMLLNRYFDAGGASAFGTGQSNPAMLAAFKRNSMTQVAGVRAGEAGYATRGEVCGFFDERRGLAQKLGDVHQLLQGDMARARGYFRRIEKLFAAATPAERQSPSVKQALARIAADEAARERYVAFMRNAQPGERARMIALAGELHWLDGDAVRSEQAALVGDLLQKASLTYADVDLACDLDAELALPPGGRTSVAHAAVRACVGDASARPAVLRGLASSRDDEVQAVQAYLRHRSIDASELREVTARVAQMRASPAQVRALEALSRLNVKDPQALTELSQAYASAGSPQVQRAIAEVFLRGDVAAVDRPELASVLQEHRLEPRAGAGGGDLIDVLLRQLASAN